jgi:dCMP deaminase
MMIPHKDLQLYTKLINTIRYQSTASRAQVGCVIIDSQTRNIVSFGYNGMPSGYSNVCEQDGITKDEVIHAEVNALRKLSWFQRWFRTRYVCIVSHMPCISCSQALVSYGIRQIYYLTPYGDGKGVEYLLSKNCTVKRILLGS